MTRVWRSEVMTRHMTLFLAWGSVFLVFWERLDMFIYPQRSFMVFASPVFSSPCSECVDFFSLSFAAARWFCGDLAPCAISYLMKSCCNFGGKKSSFPVRNLRFIKDFHLLAFSAKLAAVSSKPETQAACSLVATPPIHCDWLAFTAAHRIVSSGLLGR